MCEIQFSKKELNKRRMLFDQFLKCIDREENLVHYRMSWCLQWNLACFAALFTIGIAIPSGKIDVNAVNLLYFFSIPLTIIGVLVSIISYIGIKAALNQITFLIEEVEERLLITRHNWTNSGFIRPYGDPNTSHLNARRVAAFFPLVFVLFWIASLTYAIPHVFQLVKA